MTVRSVDGCVVYLTDQLMFCFYVNHTECLLKNYPQEGLGSMQLVTGYSKTKKIRQCGTYNFYSSANRPLFKPEKKTTAASMKRNHFVDIVVDGKNTKMNVGGRVGC